MAGIAATASIARSAASIINFFIPLLLFLSTRQSLQDVAQTTITLSNRVEHYATLEPNIMFMQHPATSSLEESYANRGLVTPIAIRRYARFWPMSCPRTEYLLVQCRCRPL